MATLYGSIGFSPHAKAPTPSLTAKLEDYVSKVAAHIPSEVVTIYLIGRETTTDKTIVGIWAVVCWVIALIIRWVGTQGDGKVLNVVLTTLAFPIWVMAVGGTILGFAFSPPIPALIVLAFAVLAAAFYNNK